MKNCARRSTINMMRCDVGGFKTDTSIWMACVRQIRPPFPSPRTQGGCSLTHCRRVDELLSTSRHRCSCCSFCTGPTGIKSLYFCVGASSSNGIVTCPGAGGVAQVQLSDSRVVLAPCLLLSGPCLSGWTNVKYWIQHPFPPLIWRELMDRNI